MESYQGGGKEASGRWARELVWAHGLGGKGRQEAGGEEGVLWESGCKTGFGECRGGLGLRKKGRFVSDAAWRLDPPAATGSGVTVEIVLSMANTEQVSP